MLRAILFAVFVLCSVPAHAGYEEGVAAYEKKDYATALKEFEPIAIKGEARAQYQLALVYWDGQKNSKEYLKWLQLSANQGYAAAQFELGLRYEVGSGYNEGIIQDKSQEILWLSKAGEQGYLKAQKELGSLFGSDGSDYKKAAYWYTKAAEQGDEESQHELGVYYKWGNGVPQNKQKSFYWFTKEAEHGESNAQSSLAEDFKKEKDYKHAIFWYTKAAEQGYNDAQRNLAEMYLSGQGIAKNNVKSFYWYKKAATNQNQVDIESMQYQVGLMYLNGVGVSKDNAQASHWFELALKKAREGALNNFSWDMALLGKMYRDGFAVKKSPVVALAWLRVAETQRQDALALEMTLTPDQRESAKKLADNRVKGSLIPDDTDTSASTNIANNTGTDCRPHSATLTCQSSCTNGDCIVTYENGCKVRVQVNAKFNSMSGQWEYPSPGC